MNNYKPTFLHPVCMYSYAHIHVCIYVHMDMYVIFVIYLEYAINKNYRYYKYKIYTFCILWTKYMTSNFVIKVTRCTLVNVVEGGILMQAWLKTSSILINFKLLII